MKKVITTLFILCFFYNAFAQAPQGIPYQSIMRNGAGVLIINTTVSLRFSIHDSAANGNIVYQETHSTPTNGMGMITVSIGQGTSVSGIFSTINWGQNTKFMQVEMDASGGTNYTDLGTQQMMSVPYALYAEKSGTAMSTAGFTHWIGELYGGGVVFSVSKDSNGTEHGLIVALNDQGTSEIWSNVNAQNGNQNTAVGSGAQSEWDGMGNSLAIVNQIGHINSAAKLCLDLVSGGQSDWYLPSITELIQLYTNVFNVNQTLRMTAGATKLEFLQTSVFDYWSSTEMNYQYVYFKSFRESNYSFYPKQASAKVRAIRSY